MSAAVNDIRMSSSNIIALPYIEEPIGAFSPAVKFPNSIIAPSEEPQATYQPNSTQVVTVERTSSNNEDIV